MSPRRLSPDAYFRVVVGVLVVLALLIVAVTILSIVVLRGAAHDEQQCAALGGVLVDARSGRVCVDASVLIPLPAR